MEGKTEEEHRRRTEAQTERLDFHGFFICRKFNIYILVSSPAVEEELTSGLLQQQARDCVWGQRSEVRGGVTPDVGHAVARAAAAAVLGAEREVGVALLRGGRVLGQELHDVWVVGVAPQAAATDDVHDARQHVAGAAAQRPHPPGAAAPRPSGQLLLLARIQDLQVGGDREPSHTHTAPNATPGRRQFHVNSQKIVKQNSSARSSCASTIAV